MRTILPFVYLLLILAVNFHACKKAFVTDYTNHFFSMHGEWIALAKLGGFDWWRPMWFPFQSAGLPLEYSYAPLIPVIVAALTRWFAIPPELAFHSIAGVVYCIGPAAMFVLWWRTLGTPGWGFVAAMLYSLTSLTSLFLPDRAFHLADILSARRLYLAFVWDDAPRLFSLALLPVAVLMLARSLQRRSFPYAVAAGFCLSAMMLANMFGVVLTAIAAITVPLAIDRELSVRRVLESAAIAFAAWVAVCPFVPPSLIATVSSNVDFNGEVDSTLLSRVALAGVGVLTMLVWRIASRLASEWPVRWLILFTTIVASVALLFQYGGIRVVPQPARYKIETELAVCFLLVFALRRVAAMLPVWIRFVVAACLLLVAWRQVGALRQFDREIMRPIDVRATIEYRAAKWVDANLPDARVMMGGSLAQWLNIFTDVAQLAGGPYTTAPNQVQQTAVNTIYGGDAEISLLWLKAFGVSAIAVPGPNSPEFWKPFPNPAKFDGKLPVLWREDDTTIYAVSQPACSLAHVMRPETLVMHRPRDGRDIDEIRRYVVALDSGTGCSSVRWEGRNRAIVQARADRGDVVSVQVNYFPGWRASANGRRVDVQADGLGLMVVKPACAGECTIVLEYAGSAEFWICRAASLGLMLLVLGLLVAQRNHRVRRSGSMGGQETR